MKTRVVHVRDHVPDAIYVGRPTRWGNPFKMSFGAGLNERRQVIEQYRIWLSNQPELIERAREDLQGRVLACFCSPRPCHADVLAAVADGEDP